MHRPCGLAGVIAQLRQRTPRGSKCSAWGLPPRSGGHRTMGWAAGDRRVIRSRRPRRRSKSCRRSTVSDHLRVGGGRIHHGVAWIHRGSFRLRRGGHPVRLIGDGMSMAWRGRWRVCEEGFPGKPVRRKLGRVDLWLGRLGWLLAAVDLSQGGGGVARRRWMATWGGGGWGSGGMAASITSLFMPLSKITKIIGE